MEATPPTVNDGCHVFQSRTHKSEIGCIFGVKKKNPQSLQRQTMLDTNSGTPLTASKGPLPPRKEAQWESRDGLSLNQPPGVGGNWVPLRRQVYRNPLFWKGKQAKTSQSKAFYN